MKSIKIMTLIFLVNLSTSAVAQEKYNAFNLGVGVGYYGYLGYPLPVVMMNYEFNVARNFTLAPFVGFYNSSRKYRWDHNDYYYTETVIPIGMKGTYYFDELLKAGSKWDFYVGGSLGYSVVMSAWDDGYYGDRNHFRGARPIYADVHIGAEYHVAKHLGLFLDLSSGLSTFGLAFH